MIRPLILFACLLAGPAFADEPGPSTMPHAGSMAHGHGAPGSSHAATPTEVGQGAFAAIQEAVAILEADPNTDWSKVDIDTLRRHLIDMDNVTLRAKVVRATVDGGVRFDVTGEGPIADSIRRMVLAHAAMMNGADGWTFAAEPIEGGAALTVRTPPEDLAKLEGLGFFGVMTLGMHHGTHHLMIARGRAPTR